MADVLTPEQRKRCMSRIKSKGTKLEKMFREFLEREGIPFSEHPPSLRGKPDFLIPPDILVFLDSCFWHMCPEHCRIPETNREWWRAKLERNAERDAFVTAELESAGWRVLRLWEHEVKDGSFKVRLREALSSRSVKHVGLQKARRGGMAGCGISLARMPPSPATSCPGHNDEIFFLTETRRF